MMGVTEQLARMVVETSLEDLPPQVIEHSKERVLDSFAVMVGGAFEESTRIAEQYVCDVGGALLSRVVGRPWRTSPPNAALINGVASHALDYDETSQMVSHVTPNTFPAILATADLVKASGKDILMAYILAFEFQARIGWGTMAVTDMHLLGWHPVPVIGALAATAGAARILRLDLDATRRAIGIAAAETGGIRKNIGTMTKPLHAGKSARNGVSSAMMAQRGYTADLDVLEGVPSGYGHSRYGFCETFCREGNYNLDAMVKDLGKHWELDIPRTVTTKAHPGATGRATPMDITIELCTRYDLKPEEIERIDVATNTGMLAVSSYPWAHNGLDARYSLVYDIAISAVDRKGGLEQYTDARVQEADVQAFMKKINVFVDPEIDRLVDHPTHSKERGASRVTIHTTDGQSYSDHRMYTKGYPQDPMLWDDIVEKYLECAEYAGLPRIGVDPRPLIDMVRDIETLEDGTRLLASLTPPA